MKSSYFLTGYAFAVSAGVSISVGLNYSIKNSRMSQMKPYVKQKLKRFIRIPPIVLASIINLLLMRRYELREGINVMDENEKVVGVSQLAARSALTQMVVSRASLVTSIIFLPSLFMTFYERQSFFSFNYLINN